jgi:hypothetical protein
MKAVDYILVDHKDVLNVVISKITWDFMLVFSIHSNFFALEDVCHSKY